MKINFYGVKNAAALQTESGYVKMTKHGLAPASRHITLQAEITDKNSNDLEQLSPVLNVFKNRTNQNALNFTLDEYTTDRETFRIYGINGDVINLNRQSAPVFQKLQKFFTLLGSGKMMSETAENFSHSNESLFAFKRHFDGDAERFKSLCKKAVNDSEGTVSCAQYIARKLKFDIDKFLLEERHKDEYFSAYF